MQKRPQLKNDTCARDNILKYKKGQNTLRVIQEGKALILRVSQNKNIGTILINQLLK
jgi:hypothetical protein